MTRNVTVILLVLLGSINNALALPWFETTRDLSKHSVHQAQDTEKAANNGINFSGIWTGQCDNNPAVDLLIKHDNNKFSISYGFMEEHFILGEIKSNVISLSDASENNSTTVRWSNDNTALIFINNNLFTSEGNHLNVFFSKVSMSLQEELLIVAGYHYQTDATLGEFNRETMLCNYHKK